MSDSDVLGSGVFASVYASKDGMVEKKYSMSDIKDASKEINILTTIKNNRAGFKAFCNDKLGFYSKSSIITIKGWSLKEGPVIKMKRYACTLQDLMMSYYKKAGKVMDIEIAKQIHFKIMFGLAELQYSNIIHGDLKPENILISLDSSKLPKTSSMRNGKKKINKFQSSEDITNFIITEESKAGGVDYIIKCIVVKIIDFNKSFIATVPFKPLDIQTIYYTPPEIIVGDYFYNNSVDIWTAGCILYEMLTHSHLFNINNKTSIQEEDSDVEEEANEEESGNYTSDEDLYFIHLALLHCYDRLLGMYPVSLLDKVKNKNIYFSNDIIIGGSSMRGSNIKAIQVFNTFFNEIFERTFKYNYKERLTIEEYFTLYLRNN